MAAAPATRPTDGVAMPAIWHGVRRTSRAADQARIYRDAAQARRSDQGSARSCVIWLKLLCDVSDITGRLSSWIKVTVNFV
jgi:hypothetical protein